MNPLDASPQVTRLAASLGLDWRRAPTAAVIEFCKQRVSTWLREEPEVQTPTDLERLVCGKLRLTMEEFHTDEQLDEIIRRYVAMGEFVFAAQKDGFDSKTFATLIRRDHATPESTDQFVALIDCRADEAARRRFFTRWHEIAHVLALAGGEMADPVHRSTASRDPIEQLMDKIAGEIGFFEPLLGPAIEAAIRNAGGVLDFGVVDRVRTDACPDASFQATLIAVVRMAPVAALSIEAGLGLKKEEQDLTDQPGLFPSLPPEAKLRALKVGGNEAAKLAGLRINPNMRVPDGSVIAALFKDPAPDGILGTVTADESLSIWTHSDGRRVGDQRVRIQARRWGDQVVALVTLR